MTTPTCPYCNSASKLVKGRDIYPRAGKVLGGKNFYQCKPCDALVGCHPGTTVALGRLADAELRQAKMAAHSLFDLKWRTGGMKRKDAYGWLAEKLGINRKDCHIGMMDVDMCQRVVEVCR